MTFGFWQHTFSLVEAGSSLKSTFSNMETLTSVAISVML